MCGLHGGDDVGEAWPEAVGHRAVASDERGRELGIAMHRYAMAAGEPEQLGRAYTSSDRGAQRHRLLAWVPRDGDRDVIAE
jgi:hypothetical protein